MLLTSSTKTRIPQHSAGWGVMRLITDRGGKNTVEHPSVWGRHRELTAPEAFALLEHRVRTANQLKRTRETRP